MLGAEPRVWGMLGNTCTTSQLMCFLKKPFPTEMGFQQDGVGGQKQSADL